MRKLLVLFLLLIVPVFLMAQSAQLNKEKLDIDVLAGISTFSLDGQVKVFEAPMAVGLKYKGLDEDINVGYYLAPVIDEGNTSNSSLSMMLYIDIFKDFGFGFGYKFWLINQGIVSPEKKNLYLSFNFSLLKINVR